MQSIKKLGRLSQQHAIGGEENRKLSTERLRNWQTAEHKRRVQRVNAEYRDTNRAATAA
jgi:hypothetical protein